MTQFQLMSYKLPFPVLLLAWNRDFSLDVQQPSWVCEVLMSMEIKSNILNVNGAES